MAKFNLGDRVVYRAKNMKREFHGVIIANYGDHYLLCPDDEILEGMEAGNLYFGRKTCGGNQKLNQYFDSETHSWLRRTLKPCTWVTKDSRALHPGEYEYVPSQEGDKDDDI